ncbi:MAG: hypothetical protein CL424_02350 [Acidimicrobiaceae bacterium]|nr:hypothetical protein [Acidimicrobiaceae bacterium]
MLKVVDPIGEIAGTASTGETWQLDLTGQTLGILCNGKANASPLLEAVAARLALKFNLAGIIRADKSHEASGPGLPAPPEMIDRLASGAVAVLVASGD